MALRMSVFVRPILAFAACGGLDLVGVAALRITRAMLATTPLSQVSVAASPLCSITERTATGCRCEPEQVQTLPLFFGGAV